MSASPFIPHFLLAVLVLVPTNSPSPSPPPPPPTFSVRAFFYTAVMWAKENDASEADRRALGECVRLPHVPSIYLGTVIGGGAGMQLGIDGRDVSCAFAYAATQPKVKECMQRGKNVPASKRAAWQLSHRPAAGVREVVVEWRFPLERLRSLHEAAAAGTFGSEYMPLSDHKVLHGVEWSLSLRVRKAEGGATTSFVVQCNGSPGHQGGGVITASSVVMQAGPITQAHHPYSCQAGYGLGFRDCFQMGNRWDELAWRAKEGLVEADGKMLLRATISGVCMV